MHTKTSLDYGSGCGFWPLERWPTSLHWLCEGWILTGTEHAVVLVSPEHPKHAGNARTGIFSGASWGCASSCCNEMSQRLLSVAYALRYSDPAAAMGRNFTAIHNLM